MLLRDISDRAKTGVELVRRSYDIVEYELRADSDGDGFTFEGVASVVDKPYTVRDMLGEFTETIKGGAFNKTLRDSKADVALFVNHNSMAAPLATRAGGGLTLRADPDLRVTARLNPLRPDVLTVREAINDGDLRQMSIGFTVPAKRDEWNEDFTERIIHEVKLIETSIVWQGANQLTSAGMRTFDEFMESLADVEMTDDEIRRALATLEARLAPAETAQERGTKVSAELIDLWAKRYAV